MLEKSAAIESSEYMILNHRHGGDRLLPRLPVLKPLPATQVLEVPASLITIQLSGPRGNRMEFSGRQRELLERRIEGAIGRSK
jgi:hypothetical protein